MGQFYDHSGSRLLTRAVQKAFGNPARGDGDNEISLLVRGYSNASLVLIDEASRVPDELYISMRPLRAVMSTPFGQR